jgi:hypothetical protein
MATNPLAAEAHIEASASVPKITVKQPLSRTRQNQKRLIETARSVRQRNARPLPPVRQERAPVPAATFYNQDEEFPDSGDLHTANDRQPPVGQTESTALSEPSTASTNQPKYSSRVDSGFRGPTLGAEVSPDEAPEENQKAGEEEEGNDIDSRRAEEENARREAQERVNRIRQTRAYGLLTMQEGFTKKLEELKKSKATLFQYAPAASFALLKDLSDIIFVGSLPGLGTVVSFCCSVAIFLILFLTRVNKKLVDSRFLLRMVVALALGTLIEFLPGVNFLPIETVTILLIYFMDKHLSDKKIALVTEELQGLRGKRV